MRVPYNGSPHHAVRSCPRSERIQHRVQGLTRPHDRLTFASIRLVVAADVHSGTLHAVQLINDVSLVCCELLSQRRKVDFQLRIGVLRCECLGPIQSQVEVATAIVELAHPP